MALNLRLYLENEKLKSFAKQSTQLIENQTHRMKELADKLADSEKW